MNLHKCETKLLKLIETPLNIGLHWTEVTNCLFKVLGPLR